jgi:hypothetical protein
MPNVMMSIQAILYQSLQTVESLNLPAGEAASGKKFEDYVVKQLYQQLLRRSEDRVFTPRHTLHEPTFSGVFHQFDIVIARPNETVAVECKFRGGAHIDQLFATHGKLVDYRLRPHGVFVTTARGINDEIYCYALAHRIHIICLLLPPVEYMLECTKKGTSLTRMLEDLQQRIEDNLEPRRLLIEWKHTYDRFQAEGYCR